MPGPLTILFHDIRVSASSFASNARELVCGVVTLDGGSVTLLTRTFLHPGVVCVLHIPDGQGALRLEGIIKECTHHSGVEHLAVLRLQPRLEHEAVQRLHARAAAPADGAVRALLIDDHRAQRQLVMHALPPRGVAVEAVASAEEALGLLATQRFDVMLVDHHLEEETGLDVVGRLVPTAFAGPVIFFTAETSGSAHQQMISAGAACVLVKPVHPQVIAATARAVAQGGAVARLPQISPAQLEASPAARAFAMELRQFRTLLNASPLTPDTPHWCRTVAATAGSFGLFLLARVADRALVAMELGADPASPPIDDLRVALDEILAAAA